MDNVDRDKLRGVIETTALIAVYRSHGEKGTRSFRDLARGIRTIFDHVDPEQFDGLIIAFRCLDDADRPIPEKKAIKVQNPAILGQEVAGDVVIQILADGRLLLWKGVSVDVQSMAASAVVYRYRKAEEHFYSGTTKTEIEKVGQYASLYSVPAFSDLRLALEHYRNDMAKESSCKILQRAWSDENRLFFVNRPESIMRDSLTQFLKISLRDAEVRPEQNMDETHPVDVKVTFTFTTRLAVIEIKWVGISICKTPRKITANYRDKRARVGARRLVDYLDWNRQQAPNRITRGYLVVFDARRRGLKKNTKRIDQLLGGYYRNRDLRFDPKFEELRDDFDPPIRMFVEPVV
jgi:hypothetical protein